jgi:hypothetical protein
MSAEAPTTTRESKILEAQNEINEIGQKFDKILADSKQLRETLGEDYDRKYLSTANDLGLHHQGRVFDPGVPSEDFFAKFLSGLQDKLEDSKLQDDPSAFEEDVTEVIVSCVAEQSLIDNTIYVLDRLKEEEGNSSEVEDLDGDDDTQSE